MNNFFRYREATEKLHRTVKTRTTFADIPAGTTGTAHRVEQSLDGCSVVIQWHLPYSPASRRSRWPYEDWFSKNLYQEYLTEEGQSLKGAGS